MVIQPEVTTSWTAAISSAPIEGREKGKKSRIINFLELCMATF
ncbi:hypothetical protein CSB67_1292 [Enterobacter hormaechei]|nr:hypothetical protein CSB67_1292 [Enterobacter hormaechei]